MSPEMFGATIRALMQLASGYMLALGMNGETWATVTGGVVALATWVWSMWQKKQAAEK